MCKKHILQMNLKTSILHTFIREHWPECKMIHGRARHPQSQGSVERVNKGIKKVLGSFMRKSKDPGWVKNVNRTQYSINTSPHSTSLLLKLDYCIFIYIYIYIYIYVTD